MGDDRGQDPGTQDPVKWEDQLSESLDAAFHVSKPWDDDVRDAIFYDRQDTFRDREKDYKGDTRKQVLSAAALAGKVARLCADHLDHQNVTKDDMLAGIAAAKHVCKARLMPVDVLLFWCQ